MTFLAKHQQGSAFISVLFILVFIGAILKIGPIYMDHSDVANSLASLESMADVKTMTKRDLWDNLENTFDLNRVEHISKDDVKITKQDGYVKVEIVYERVEKIVGNLSVLAEFSESFEIDK